MEFINKIIAILGIITLTIFILTFNTSCQSYRQWTDGNILQYQRRVSELEGECQRLRDKISRVNELTRDSIERVSDIQRRGAEISDSVDRIIYLFGEYESEVFRLLEGYGINGALSEDIEGGIDSRYYSSNNADNL